MRFQSKQHLFLAFFFIFFFKFFLSFFYVHVPFLKCSVYFAICCTGLSPQFHSVTVILDNMEALGKAHAPCVPPLRFRPRGCCFYGKAAASKAADLDLIPAFAVVLFPGRVRPVTSKWVLRWLPRRVSGVLGQHWDWSAWCQYTTTG